MVGAGGRGVMVKEMDLDGNLCPDNEETSPCFTFIRIRFRNKFALHYSGCIECV